MQSSSAFTLRQDQRPVYKDGLAFINAPGKSPWGRIIMPPRTGKTVVAGELIAETGRHTTYLVPSLVDQTVKRLREQLPGTGIGYCDKLSDNLVSDGVNVLTYRMAQMRYADGTLDKRIRNAKLVFPDEAHVAMTKHRMDMLVGAFKSDVPRVALTATPDYSEQRTLATHFPELIHEIELTEAVDMGLLAPFRWWLMEVDVDASGVRVIGDDYDAKQLGRAMTNARLFQAVKRYRYSDAYRTTGALICCRTQDQALALERFLIKHGPKGVPGARVIIDTTSEKDRIAYRDGFDNGTVDTLITVGVLVQGWDAPRCKLLIDIAPSGSYVRSAQKYCRPLTVWENQWATTLVFVPKGLRLPPILPADVFAESADAYADGQLVAPKDRDPTKRHRARLPVIKHDGVEVQMSIAAFSTIGKEADLKGNWKLVREIVHTSPDFDFQSPCGFTTFKWIGFQHPAFVGCGLQLMRSLGFPPTGKAYEQFIADLTPDGYAARWVARKLNRQLQHGLTLIDPVIEDFEAAKCLADHKRGELTPSAIAEYYLEFLHGNISDWDTERAYSQRALEEHANRLFKTLTPREEKVLRMRYGIGVSIHEAESTVEKIADCFDVTSNRICQIENAALRKARHPSRSRVLGEFVEPSPRHEPIQLRSGPTQKSLENEFKCYSLTPEEQIAKFGLDRYRKLVGEIQFERWLRGTNFKRRPKPK